MFSVLMSVYKGEKTEYFKPSMDSVLSQSLLPDEIILIRDGMVYEELQEAIDFYLKKFPSLFSYYPFDENRGLGLALAYGVEHSKNNLIIRMDTDDICEHDRFEKQINYLNEHEDVSVLGGQIYEFIDNPEEIYDKREVPITNDKISKFLKKRNPFNHMTVAYRKNDVLDSGNYQDLQYLEDYYLWCRMYAKGFKFANLEDVFVRARVNQNTFERRSGLSYFNSYLKLENYKLKHNVINIPMYLYNLIGRFFVHVLLPNKLRTYLFKFIARK